MNAQGIDERMINVHYYYDVSAVKYTTSVDIHKRGRKSYSLM